MSKKLILILAIVMIAMSQTTADLTFSLANTKYTKANDFWTVDVPCSGGSGKYQYTCELPTGWKLENNLFKIPSSCSTNYNFEYVARCKVIDLGLGKILERALAFKSTISGYVVTDKDYFYGLMSYTSSLSATSGADILNRLNTLTSSITSSFGSLSTNFGSLTTLNGYSSGIFAGLPTWLDCDKFISDGNIAEILALIQKVVSNTNMKCDAKVAWLNDLLGRINAALAIKKESILQIQILINGIAESVQKLVIQIQTLQSEQLTLNITSLKTQIDQLMVKLQLAYNDYNTCTGSCQSYDADLIKYQKEQKDLEIKIEQLRITIEQYTSKRSQLDIDIAALEKKLAELKAQRKDADDKITTITIEYNSTVIRLTEVKTQITIIIGKINDGKSKCESLKNIYLQLEIDLKTLQEKYNQSVARYDAITQQIASIKIEIDRQNSQSSEYSIKLNVIKQCVGNLESAIKQIQQSINYVQFQCNDCKDVTIIDKDIESIFKFDRNSWFTYMNKCYGASIPQIEISFPTISIDVKVVTVYSSSFSSTYGSCFGDQIKSKSTQWGSQSSLGFDGDFSCSNGFDSVVGRKGKIRAINNKYVDVDCDDGSQARLRLGSCSRFEGQGKDFVPKVGQNIHFKGAKNTDSTFNLHTCSCY